MPLNLCNVRGVLETTVGSFCRILDRSIFVLVVEQVAGGPVFRCQRNFVEDPLVSARPCGCRKLSKSLWCWCCGQFTIAMHLVNATKMALQFCQPRWRWECQMACYSFRVIVSMLIPSSVQLESPLSSMGTGLGAFGLRKHRVIRCGRVHMLAIDLAFLFTRAVHARAVTHRCSTTFGRLPVVDEFLHQGSAPCSSVVNESLLQDRTMNQARLSHQLECQSSFAWEATFGLSWKSPVLLL